MNKEPWQLTTLSRSKVLDFTFKIGIVLVLAILSQSFLAELRTLEPFISLLQQLKNGLLQHPGIVAACLALSAIILGGFISLWKQRAQTSYGMAEIVFGALLSYNSIVKLSPNFEFAKLFAVGTAIYVIARGFNNVRDARGTRLEQVSPA